MHKISLSLKTPYERRPAHAAVKLLIGVGFVAAVVLLLMWLAGWFHPKIGGAAAPAPVTERPVGDAKVVAARTIRIPATETAVGTIRAVHETEVASKLLAKVVEVNVVSGSPVSAGDVLVRLDDADLKARLQQAEAAIRDAEARRDQARIEFERLKDLHGKGLAAQIEYDRAGTQLRSAEADLNRAEQSREEAAAILEYATIRAPLDGIVVQKQVEAGDTARPGQVLLTLNDPTRMQLVARVRESLAHRLKVGQQVQVGVEAINKTCQGNISEIVPEAESASRSFSVKVTGPCPDGIYSGMFGRMQIPLDDREVLVIPRRAVRHVGQLDLVDVVEGEGADQYLRRRAVQLGNAFGDDVQVLAGLRAGERVAIPASNQRADRESTG